MTQKPRVGRVFGRNGVMFLLFFFCHLGTYILDADEQIAYSDRHSLSQ